MQNTRIFQTMDGNAAAAHVAYAFTEVSAIYPITPSSPMSELMDEWAGQGRQNIFGSQVPIYEMQSEAGAAGAIHGALIAGALASTFTSSQGLLLMLPNLYRMAGEHLPGVIHVAARTIATHALSIFGDHSDIYACRQTGAAIWASSNVQEVMDLTPVVYMSALEGSLPFLNFFDGFRTSHELQKTALWDYSDLAELFPYDALERFRARALHPDNGRMYGSAQNPDIFFQAHEASNPLYDALPDIVENNLQKVNEKLGTSYGLMDYYGDPAATHIIIAMGSVCDTIREYLEMDGTKKGLINLHLYRPFPVKQLLSCIPDTVQQITVLCRTKEQGAPGSPLYLDVLSALQNDPRKIRVYSGCYGLSSKDTLPSHIAAVYANTEKIHFTLGIDDDVTHLSLTPQPVLKSQKDGLLSCKFWGLGGDGTISATKNILKIVGNHTDLQVQGYFEYDSKKSRGLTISHLRFGNAPIRSAYPVSNADFVACHNPMYLHKYRMIEDLTDGGIFLLNLPLGKDLFEFLPSSTKKYIAEHNIRLFTIDAFRIAKEIGLNGKINTILQAAFFKVTGLLPEKEAIRLMTEAAQKTYQKSGSNVFEKNEQAIIRGFAEVQEVDVSEWTKKVTEKNDTVDFAETTNQLTDSLDHSILPCRQELEDFVKNIQQPVTDQHGNELPVSAFLPYADGFTPPGSSAHERRNVTTEIPVWIPENCIQCNRCSFVCPHAVIRPAVLDREAKKNAPEGMATIPMMGVPEHDFAITVSQVDCTGCGSCVAVCPGKGPDKKALNMCPIAEHKEHQEYFDYAKPLLPNQAAIAKFGPATVKGSQFSRPYMEFSGACAGCGETPYVKLLTQLFGPHLYIANATGCSSIWANSAPTTAYCLNEKGQGPAWSNSLFEDAAEFGYGMWMAQEVRNRLKTSPNDNEADKISQWIIGGDGWAYDIGYGGLDHVLASGRNINILVLDTEVYSNTGGQASKATPMGSTAAFASTGKTTRKKDLAAMAMTYGNVYVAQIAMGADFNQTVKAFKEAAEYPGPSLIIAYATCIAHGIKSGMGSSSHEVKKAVDSGYFHLFRFCPNLAAEGKNPFQLDSKAPTLNYEEFLAGENRYEQLRRKNPERARQLFEEASQMAQKRYQHLKKLQAFYEPEETKEV